MVIFAGLSSNLQMHDWSTNTNEPHLLVKKVPTTQSTACYSDMFLWLLHKKTAEEASADGFTTVHALKDEWLDYSMQVTRAKQP